MCTSSNSYSWPFGSNQAFPLSASGVEKLATSTVLGSRLLLSMISVRLVTPCCVSYETETMNVLVISMTQRNRSRFQIGCCVGD